MTVTDEGEKKFVMKHVFKDVKKQLIDKGGGAVLNGPVEVQCGVEWKIRLHNHVSADIEFKLDCLKTDQSNNWSIETEFEAFASGKKISGTKSAKFSKNRLSNGVFNIIDEYEQYSANNNMPVEFHVIIKKITGIEKKKLTNFADDAAKEHSDVKLKIGDQKFYVYKSYLSRHSTYFKSLFSGNFAESNKSEIELKDIDPNDFHDFLELIYGESLVNDKTVAGILKLADFFDSKTAIRRCEEFLLNRSEHSLKFKFHAAIKYNLEKLKIKCMNLMKTKDDLRDLAPEDADDFSPAVWKELYNKYANID